MADARRTFGPVVLLGLASSALAAAAASKPWTEAEPPNGEAVDLPLINYDTLAKDSPLAVSLALVMLAAWGVLLVTRGWVRRAVAAVATLSAAGFLATAIDAYASLKDAVVEDLRDYGVTGEALDRSRGAIWMNDWYPTAIVAGVLALLAGLAALRWAGKWPEMGSRYDAPTASTAPAPPGDGQFEQTNLDLWKSLDEGHDPTA